MIWNACITWNEGRIADRLNQLHAVADTLFGWWLHTVEKKGQPVDDAGDK